MGATHLKIDTAFEAMMKKDWSQIKSMYEDYISGGAVGEPPFVLGGSLLHLAVWSKEEDLLWKMLDVTPPDAAILKIGTSEDDNSILHEAVHGGNKEMVPRILEKMGSLIERRNRRGETPLYTAAAVGNTDMVKLLYSYVQGSCRSTTTRRDDGNTILHASVHGLFFDTAIQVAQLYPHLVYQQDQNGMTPLHLIACMPSKVEKHIFISMTDYKGFCRWITGHSRKWHIEHLVDHLLDNYERYKKLEPIETPLSMAAKHGMTLVVEKILLRYPSEVEYVNNLGENLLHLAIKNRQQGVFNLLKHGNPIVLQRLARRVDRNGNTVLHHGEFNETQDWDKAGTYFPMHWEYEWFKSVEKITPRNLIEHRNKRGKTAKELFIDSHANFKKEDEKFLKKSAIAFSVVVSLMASTAFAALHAYPGGPDQNNGMPHFGKKPAIYLFLAANALTIFFSIRALLYFLFVISFRYRENSFHQPFLSYMIWGVRCLYASVFFMMLTLVAIIVLLVKSHILICLYTIITATFLYYIIIFIRISFGNPLNLPWQIHLPM